MAWLLCELCNFSGVKDSLDDGGRAEPVIASQQGIVSVEWLFIPELPVGLGTAKKKSASLNGCMSMRGKTGS